MSYILHSLCTTLLSHSLAVKRCSDIDRTGSDINLVLTYVFAVCSINPIAWSLYGIIVTQLGTDTTTVSRCLQSAAIRGFARRNVHALDTHAAEGSQPPCVPLLAP